MAITVVFEITDGLLWESSAGRICSAKWSHRSFRIGPSTFHEKDRFTAPLPMVVSRLYNRVF